MSPPPSPSPSAGPSRSRSTQMKLDNYRPMDQRQMEKCHMAVTYYIVVCMRPLNTVEKPGFQVLCRTLNPRYKVMSRRTLARNFLPKFYQATRENVSALMKGSEFVALTTDIWTSDAHDSYMSLTALFLDESWKLVEVTLCCKKIEDDHTAPILKQVLMEMLDEWEISLKSKVSGVTSDNGENIRLALELLDEVPNHMRCFGHTVNNGVTDVIKGCQGLKASLAKAHSLRSWLSSDKVWRAYERYVQENHNKTPKVLPAPCKTRWWVDLHIAEAVVGQFQWMWGFATSYSRGKHFSEIPTRGDISILKAYVKALKPIEKVSTLLCAERYVTCSLVLPMTYILDPSSDFYAGDDMVLSENLSQQWETEDNDEAQPDEYEDDDDIPLSDYNALQPRAIHAAIAAKLNKRYNPSPTIPQERDLRATNEFTRGVACNELLCRCSYLDPRFRSVIKDADQTLAKQKLFGDAEADGVCSMQPKSTPQEEHKSGVSSAVSAVMSLFRKRRQEQQERGGSGEGQAQANAETNFKRAFEQEVAIYEGLPDVDLTNDPFTWWNDHKGSLPILSRLARKYLIIPASSVPSERLFSTGGNVITDTRSSLTGANAEMLIFCAQNEKYCPLPM